MHVQQSTLPNGLRVVSIKMPTAIASVGVFIHAGSRNESLANSGVAHFLEHMAFKATETRDKLQISKEIEILGATVNAYTSQDITAFYASGLGGHIPKIVEILGDLMINSRFHETDIAIESGVIIQEINQYKDDPGSIAWDNLFSSVFANQALGRPILGDEAFIQSARPEDFYSFKNNHYFGEKMVVVAAGDVDHQSFVTFVHDHFGKLPSWLDMQVTNTFEPARFKHKSSIEDNGRFQQTNIIMAWPSASKTEDYLTDRIASLAFGRGMSSPLMQEVREKRGLVYSIGAGSEPGPDYGLFYINGSATPNNASDVLKVSLDMLAHYDSHVTHDDITRAKNTVLVSIANSETSPFSLIQFVAENLFYFGKPILPVTYMDAVQNTSDEVVYAAAKKIASNVASASLVGPCDSINFENINI